MATVTATKSMAAVLNTFRTAVEAALDGNDDTKFVGPIDVRGATKCALQLDAVSGAHNTHVITVEHSIDKVTYYPDGTPQTLTGNGMKAITLAGLPYVRARITTEQGAASVNKATLAAW